MQIGMRLQRQESRAHQDIAPASIGARVLLVGLLAAALLLVVAFPLRAVGDVGLYLEIGRRVADGQLPYIDYHEINAPTFHLMNVVPVLLSRLSGLNPIVVFKLLTWALLVYASWVSIAVLRRSVGERLSVYSLALGLTAYTLSLLVLLFGQREHLILLLYVPWLTLRWHRWEDGTFPALPAVVIGFLAGMAATIKPFFVPLFVLTELYGLLTYRRQRALLTAEVGGALAFGLLLAAYFGLHPQVIINFVTQVLPLSAEGYGAYGSKPLAELLTDDPSLWYQSAFALLPWLVRRRHPLWSLARALSIAMLGGLLGYLVQLKGWNYHRIVFDGGWYLLLTLLGALVLETWRGTLPRVVRLGSLASGGVALAVPLAILIVALNQTPILSSNAAFNGLIEAHTQPGDAVLVVDPGTSPVYPGLQQTGRAQASRYVLAYPLAFAYYEQRLDDLYSPDHIPPPLAQRYLDDLALDIASRRASLILVMTEPCAECATRFNLDRYLTAQGFAAIIDAAGYEAVGEALGFRLFERDG